MAGIDKKIMAFVGTADASELITELAEHTDIIYAAVASEYGKAPHPGGNITVLSKYFDEEGMVRWINQMGVEIVIDGTAIEAAGPRQVIRSVCEKLGVEYLRIAAKLETGPHARICHDTDELLREIEYAVGNVLAICDNDLLEVLIRGKSGAKKVMPLIQADPELVSQVIAMGYPAENLICCRKILSAKFLIAAFEEFNITHMIINGDDMLGLSERLEAADRSLVKASVYGRVQEEEGIQAEVLLRQLEKRFGL